MPGIGPSPPEVARQEGLRNAPCGVRWVRKQPASDHWHRRASEDLTASLSGFSPSIPLERTTSSVIVFRCASRRRLNPRFSIFPMMRPWARETWHSCAARRVLSQSREGQPDCSQRYIAQTTRHQPIAQRAGFGRSSGLPVLQEPVGNEGLRLAPHEVVGVLPANDVRTDDLKFIPAPTTVRKTGQCSNTTRATGQLSAPSMYHLTIEPVDHILVSAGADRFRCSGLDAGSGLANKRSACQAGSRCPTVQAAVHRKRLPRI